MKQILWLCLLCVIPWLSALNTSPIIGILTLPVADDENPSGFLGSDYIPRSLLPPAKAYLPASYVKWLEQAGARVVPIPYDARQEDLDNFMKSINGLLFTGGSLSLGDNTTYFKTAYYLYNAALFMNDAGTSFPIWGTCQGLQLLSVMAAGTHWVLKCGIYDSEDLSLPLIPYNEDTLSTSYLLGASKQTTIIMPPSSAPPNHGSYNTTTVWDVLFTTNSTQNLHQCGVSPSDFMISPGLHRMFEILTTNNDRAGKPFVSTMQAHDYPFFATQWHPERPAFEWDVEETQLSHVSPTIAAMSHIASRFVDRCRYNTNHFINPAAEERALIYQYPTTYTGNDHTQQHPDQQIYYFMN